VSFSDYKTISQVQIEYKVKYDEADFIPKLNGAPSQQFLNELNFNIRMLDAFSSEAARCELIILPVLREAYKRIAAGFSLWVKKSISYDSHLNGTPDYMVSRRSGLGKTVLEYPLVIVAEAKKNDFDQGWAQCLAELIAAQRLNKDSSLSIHGIVTDGKYWEFGKLTGMTFSKNISSFVIDDTVRLFGVLDYILDLYLPSEQTTLGTCQAAPQVGLC